MFGSTSGSGWGQQQNNQQQPGAFGQPAQPSGFGAFGGGGGAFGQTQPATGAFGASAAATTPAFGGGGGFGQTQNKTSFGASTGAFGAPAATSGGFGGFGASGSTSAFGAQPAATGGLFGGSGQASTSTFGSAPTGGLFGARPAAPAAFGASTALVPAVANGTASPAYEVTQERDTAGAQSVTLHYQSISCMPAYKNSSFEELRVQDYAQGRKTAGGFGQGAAFGTQPQQPQQGGSIFGGTGFGQPAAAANPTPAFGAAPATGAFGSGGTGAFGQPAAGTSTFGQPAAGAFGSTQPAQAGSSLFGGGAGGSTFGQPAAGTQTGGFGAFGQTQNKPATGFGFGAGATTQPTSTFGGGAFGQPAQQPATGAFGQPAGQTSGFGAFGANNNQPKPSLFGSTTTTTPAFGATQPQDQNKPAGGLFGSFGQPAATAAPAFGQQPAQPTGLFGQPAANPTPSLFGQPQGQQQPATGFGGGSLFGAKPAAPTATPSLFGGFGQQNQQQNQTGTNPLMPQSATSGLFGSSTAQPAQPAAGGFGSSLFGAKPAATPSLFQSQQPAATGQPSLFGASTSTTLPGATGSIFGSSVLGGQQQQPNLVASIDQPVNHALPVFSLLPPGPRAIPVGSTSGSVIGTPSPNKKPSYFADLPTRSPVPRLGTSAYTPPGAGKLRGFASSNSGTLSGSVSNLSISGSPSRGSTASPFGSSGSLGAIVKHPTLSSMSSMGPEAFASSSSGLGLSGGRRSVKKLVLDKKPGSPGPGAGAGMSPSKSSPSKVSFNPSAGARERERERDRAPPAAIPEPASEPAPAPPEHPAQSNLADGYWIRPSLAALERATQPIDGLTIGRTGVGSVTFLVPINLNECPPVSELAGKTVLLTPKECTVYPDEDDKPAEGTGLNVRARISLEGCWAVDKANRQPIKQESHPKHVSHLRKLREMPDTKFIGFEMKTGTWSFSVEHFSKYGLGEDSDEEGDGEDDEGMDVESSPLKDRVVRHAPPPPRAADKAKEKDAGPKGNPRAVPWNVRVGVEAEKVHTMQASLFRVPEARAAAAVDASPKPGLFAPKTSTGARPVVDEAPPRSSRSSLKASANNPFVSSTAPTSTALFKPQSSTSTSTSIVPTTTRVKFTRPTSVRSTGSGAEANVFDAGLALGRSFRVSWGPGGRLVGAGRLAKASESSIREPGLKSVVSVRRVPLASTEEASLPESVQKLVRLQFTHSTVQVDDDDVPVAFPKDDLRFRHFAGLFSPELKTNEALLWRLLVALFDEIPIRLPEGTERAVVEKISAVCRRQALSDWLEVAVSAAVDAEVQSSAATQRIFAHLSGNQVARAVDEASKSGNVHLATLIAQHGSDPKLSEDIHSQLEHWREHHAAAQMDPNILRVYALLAGILDVLPGVRSNDPLDSSADIAITGSLDWRRAFGLRLWYGSSATTHDAGLALDEYEEFFNATKTALPVRGGERDAAYELIQAALRPEIPLDAALIPKTFAGNALDYRMVWHIYVVLSRVLKQRDFADRQPVDEELFGEATGHSPTADLVTSAYALQLESAGLYSEAAFVLLHLESANGRRQAIKDLLSRNYTRLTEGQLQELDQILVPEAWLHEAKAAFLVSQGKVYEAFHAFIDARQQQLAYELAVDKLVPDAVLREDLELLRNIFSQFDPETVDGWSTNGKLFVDYIEMMEAQPSYELTQAAQQLLAGIPGATADKEDKRDARWAACRARMISNLLEVTGRCGMRYSDRGEIGLVDDSSRAKHVSSLAFDSFISVLG